MNLFGKQLVITFESLYSISEADYLVKSAFNIDPEAEYRYLNFHSISFRFSDSKKAFDMFELLSDIGVDRC